MIHVVNQITSGRPPGYGGRPLASTSAWQPRPATRPGLRTVASVRPS